MSVYLTSDPHFGHAKVASIRGFTTTDEHDDAVIESYFSMMPSDGRREVDDLWILGDLTSGGRTAEEYALERLRYFSLWSGTRLHLVEGNHDSCSSIHRDGWKRQERFLKVFESVHAFARRRGPGRVPVFLSHYPYPEAGDGPHREGARYLEYRLPDHGHWLLHGHTHQPEKLSGPRSIHVGWDAWRRPVTWGEIEKIIKEEE